MPNVCAAVLKSKRRYFEESKINKKYRIQFLFYFMLFYFMTLLFFLKIKLLRFLIIRGDHVGIVTSEARNEL